MRRSFGLLCAIVILASCAEAGPSPLAPSAGSVPSELAPSRSTAALPSITASPSPTPTPDVESPAPATHAASTPASTPAPPTPAPARWVRAGRFTSPRQDTQLALLGTGEVLAAGDEPTCGIESAASDSAELWRPATSRWKSTDSLPSARTITTLIPLSDGRALVTGGANQQYVAKSSTAVYDPMRHRWRVSGLLNTARMNFAAAGLADGGALVAGGLLIDGDQHGRALQSVERWDPASGAWREIEPLSSVRMGAAATRLSDGRVLVVGGYPSWGADRPLATAEIYNPATGHWRSAGRLAVPRESFTLVALPDGGAMVLGGMAREDRAERFDPTTRTWTTVPGAAPAGERPAAVVLQDGRVLAVSGERARLFNASTGRWARTAPLPGGMWDASAVLLEDGSALVGGGWTTPPLEGATPGCPDYSSRTWRYIPGG